MYAYNIPKIVSEALPLTETPTNNQWGSFRKLNQLTETSLMKMIASNPLFQIGHFLQVTVAFPLD